MKKNQIMIYLIGSLSLTAFFLIVSFALVYSGDFFYTKILGEEILQYEAGLAQTKSSILTKNFSDKEFADNKYFSYQIKNNHPLPLSAESYLVADLESKEVIVSQNKDLVVPIASVTKLMTALVSLELLNSEDLVTISSSALGTYGDSGGFKLGDRLAAKIMLYPLLLESSNDAAEALAETAGREKFLARMNQKAKELGLKNTYFEDSSGLSPQNVSTAEDLMILIDYIHGKENFLLEITKLKKYKYDRFVWSNRNNLVNMKYYAGGKNGYTDEANRTLVSIFDLPLAELENRFIVLVLLGSKNRQVDTENLIDFLAKNVVYNQTATSVLTDFPI